MAHLVIDQSGKITAASESAFSASVIEFYKQQGYTIETGAYEKGYDGQLYRLGEAPQKSLEEQEAEAKAALQAEFTNAVQERLDTFAQTRGYDGIMSASSYATSTDPIFKAEGERAVALRDATWRACYNLLNEVLSGNRSVPTLEEVFAELPELTWE